MLTHPLGLCQGERRWTTPQQRQCPFATGRGLRTRAGPTVNVPRKQKPPTKIFSASRASGTPKQTPGRRTPSGRPHAVEPRPPHLAWKFPLSQAERQRVPCPTPGSGRGAVTTEFL